MDGTGTTGSSPDGIRLGTSGWSYDHWEGVLYPPGLPVARRRDVYVDRFDTVELNASFYRWPGERPFHRWGGCCRTTSRCR